MDGDPLLLQVKNTLLRQLRHRAGVVLVTISRQGKWGEFCEGYAFNGDVDVSATWLVR